jgi:hypothetical protein
MSHGAPPSPSRGIATKTAMVLTSDHVGDADRDTEILETHKRRNR